MGGMAVTATPKLDARKLRADFPIFEQEIHGHPFAYLDSAVTSQKPRQVLEAMTHFYETSYGNVHRGIYETAVRADAAFVEAREKVRAFLNAPSAREVIFTRNATESLNLVAYAWGLVNLGPGDVVVSTELEHHSNFVPWQYIAQRTGARFAVLPVTDEGEIDLDRADEAIGEGTVKAVAYGLISNSIGTINPAERIAAWAHERGAIAVCDAAQAVPHRRVDVQALGADFVAFSGHKMCAPTGIGALWGKAELLERMSPFILGGSMIRKVTGEKTSWNELPYKFEGGTPAFAEAVALGAAIDYLEAIGLEAIEAHEHELTGYALDRLAELPFVTVYGPPLERRGGIIAFNVGDLHPHDVAQVLDGEGVAIRAGHHCTQPLLRRLGVPATNRASFYLYSLPEEVDRLVDGLARVQEAFA
jgi:cysteine desulfurase/selenocysteine lyase